MSIYSGKPFPAFIQFKQIKPKFEKFEWHNQQDVEWDITTDPHYMSYLKEYFSNDPLNMAATQRQYVKSQDD